MVMEADYGRREGTYCLLSGMKNNIVERGGAFKTTTKMEKERANNALATQ